MEYALHLSSSAKTLNDGDMRQWTQSAHAKIVAHSYFFQWHTVSAEMLLDCTNIATLL